MGKSQYDICMEVLKRMDGAGVLSKVILIGSWCLPLYREYYSGENVISSLRTRDIDFLVSQKARFEEKINLPKLLEDLGFIEYLDYPAGHIKLIHPELIMEFLVHEKGRGSSKPHPLPFLSMNAQRLRFLDILEEDTITVTISGIKITLPHPVNFGLHKLIISNRRSNADNNLFCPSALHGILSDGNPLCKEPGVMNPYRFLFIKRSLTGGLSSQDVILS